MSPRSRSPTRARAPTWLTSLVAALVCLGSLPRVVADEPPPTPVDAANAVVRAVDGGDDAAARAAAQDPRVQPFVVLNEFLARVPARAGTPKGERMLASAERWAALVKEREEGAEAAALVARWRRLTKEEIATETAVYAALMKGGERIAAHDLDGLETVLREAGPALSAATWSLSAVALYGQAGRALFRVEGREAAAEAVFEDLARAAGRVGWAVAEIDGWDKAGGLASERHDYDRAGDCASRVAAGQLRRGALEPSARAQVNVASMRFLGGRHGEALDAVRVARERARAATAPLLETEALALEASVQSAMGRWEESRALARGIREVAARVKDPVGLRRVLFLEGHELLRLDAWEEAFEVFDTLTPLVAEGGSATERFLLERALAQLERAMGRASAAAKHARTLVEIAKAERDDDALAEARSLLALSLSQAGNDAEAAAVLAEAAKETGDRRGADAAAGEAEASIRGGNLVGAVAAARRAVLAYEHLDVPALAAQARLTLARVLLETGDRAGALSALDAAGAGLRVDPERSMLGFLRARAGAEALDAAGRPQDCAAQALAGLGVLRALSRGLAEGDATEVRHDAESLADLGVAACARWAREEPAQAPAAASLAFALAEEGRALFLAEGLLNPDALLRRELPADLVAADLSSRRAVEDARDRALRRRAAPVADAREGRAPETVALDAAWKARDAVTLRVQRAARRTAAFVEPPAPDEAAVRRALGPDEAMIVYSTGGARAAAVVLRRDAARVFDLGESKALLTRLSGWLRLVSTLDADDAEAAAALYDRLLRPLEPALEGASRWVVVPEGELSFAPIDALLRVEGGRRERVVERAVVSRAPSAGVWAALRAAAGAPAGDAVLAVGDPAAAAGDPGLPGAGAEAEEVAARFPAGRRTVLLGEGATVDRVLAALKGERRLRTAHFACHGASTPARPRASGLLLAGGAVLDVDRLARERTGADLVVLSACDSARGQVVRGEGVHGLVRAFLLAGAPRVVASDWVVADRGARRFMARFYDAWLGGASGKGMPVDRALAEAKRAALRAGGEEARPASWAAFALWGPGE